MSSPRRLLDDPSAAPWLAERVRDLPLPRALTPAARARVEAGLGARLQVRARVRSLSWPLAAAALAAVALLATDVPHAREAIGGDGGRPDVRPQPEPSPAPTAVPPALNGEETVARAAGGEVVPAAERVEPRAPVERKARLAQRARRAPVWLAQARAALARDPERTLALIHAHREPGRPVSPEVVELTILALEALRSSHAEQAATQP